MRNPSFHMESNGTALLIFHKERVASVQEFKLMVNFVLDWAEQMSTPSEWLEPQKSAIIDRNNNLNL